jgi:hypothetical protein
MQGRYYAWQAQIAEGHQHAPTDHGLCLVQPISKARFKRYWHGDIAELRHGKEI